MDELALFAGAGGGILGGKLLGWNTLCAVEIEEYQRKILLQRQRDGILNRFPIWDDIKTFDGKPWKNKIDIITGGFPCQDISAAGKGKGINGERSGLWKEMSRVVCEVQPRFVFVENSPILTSRGLYTVLGDLAEMGYNARWCVLGADDAGAPHRRKRIWILAYTSEIRCKRGKESTERKQGKTRNKLDPYSISWWNQDPADISNTNKERLCSEMGKRKMEGERFSVNNIQERENEKENKDAIKPRLDRVVDRMADTVDRIKAIGNGQVPGVAAIAFIILSEGLI